MPTINQLVKKGRSNKVRKSKSPALTFSLDTINKKKTLQIKK